MNLFSKRKSALLAAGIAFLFILGGCIQQAKETAIGSTAESSSDTGASAAVANYTGSVTLEDANLDEKDEYADWQNSSYTNIVFDNGEISIDGSGASASGSVLLIGAEGTYVLSGTLSNGILLIDAEDTDDVRIVLNNVEITCLDGAPFYVLNADKVILSLPAGTENTLTDGENYTYDYYSSMEEEPSAALFSKDDLVINGSGTLTINASYNDALTCKDDLKITGGTLILNAADDGMVGKDMVAIGTAAITITAGGDGIKSTNDTDDGKGFVAIGGGTYAITAGADGLQAETCLYIGGGIFTLSTGGGSAVSSSDNDNAWGNWGNPDNKNNKTSIQNLLEGSGDNSTATSAKALKAGSEVTVCGGSFTIDSSDDAIHSNGTISISDGKFSIASGDDGIHADTSISISGGSIVLSKSYEGIESTLIEISGGAIDITASDDGINISGGNDSSSLGGRNGQNSFDPSGGDSLHISGGTLTINASGDGIDSNGAVYISGGTVMVSGPTDSANGTLDYGSAFEVTGGTLIAVGSTGMAQNPSSGMTVYTIAGILRTTQAAGSTLSLTDATGKELLSYTSPKQYQHVIFCSNAIIDGQTYTVCVDGEAVQEVTVSSTITTFSNDAGTGNMGGGQGKK